MIDGRAVKGSPLRARKRISVTRMLMSLCLAMAGETIIVNEILNVLISIENGYAAHLKPFSGRHQPGVIHARLAKPPIRQQCKTIWHFEQ